MALLCPGKWLMVSNGFDATRTKSASTCLTDANRATAIASSGAALELATIYSGNSHEDDASVTVLPYARPDQQASPYQTR